MSKRRSPSNDLDPSAQALVGKARETQQRIIAEQREHSEAQTRLRRAHDAWVRVCQFRGDAIPRELTGEALERAYVERIMDLGRVLQADGWQNRVKAVEAGTDSKGYALTMLKKAMEGDTDTVAGMVREARINLYFGI